MKRINNFLKITVLISIFVSCNEKSWLEENPLDFYAPENSYVTTAQFRQSVNFFYNNIRNMLWNADNDFRSCLIIGNDVFYGGTDFPDLKFNNMSAFITANTYVPQMLWTICYTNISNTNEVLYRIELPNQVGEDDKKAIKGETLFFRAFFYRTLAHMYGGVPLTLEPIASPKRDFVRSTRDEVYDQCRKDLEEAIGLLQDVDKVKDGMINKQAAQHLLSEIYISLKRYDDAINVATNVISHNQMALMTERFGSRKDEKGDVYWDLFRLGNQNRSGSVNKEGIWILQYDFQNAGSNYICQFPRHALPEYYNAKVDDNFGGSVPAFLLPTAEKGGRGIGVYEGTYYFLNQNWGADFYTDIRNSESNIIRDFRIDNPNAKGFGQWMVKDGWLRDEDTLRRFYPFIMKYSRVGNFPDESYAKNSDGSRQTTALGEHILLNSSGLANGSFKDEYMFRLAETYLLRAEAFLGNNQADKAAEDINVIRLRANATPVDASQINIDYILDERMRELYLEEVRNITLCRLGKMVERSRKYNPSGYNTGDHQNLWPIPYGEIEKNIFVKMEQNPGY